MYWSVVVAAIVISLTAFSAIEINGGDLVEDDVGIPMRNPFENFNFVKNLNLNEVGGVIVVRSVVVAVDISAVVLIVKRIT